MAAWEGLACCQVKVCIKLVDFPLAHVVQQLVAGPRVLPGPGAVDAPALQPCMSFGKQLPLLAHRPSPDRRLAEELVGGLQALATRLPPGPYRMNATAPDTTLYQAPVTA